MKQEYYDLICDCIVYGAPASAKKLIDEFNKVVTETLKNKKEAE